MHGGRLCWQCSSTLRGASSSKCSFCNFASGVYPAGEHNRYVERLTEDLTRAPDWASQMGANLARSVDTVYLGGGTPTLLAPELIQKLFQTLRTEFLLRTEVEITVECAPGQLPDATLEMLAAAGVNRVSLGVQSFIDKEARETLLDVFREPHDGDIWICRRDETIRFPYGDIIHHTHDGVPYLAPELVLLFKAKHVRPKDQADFDGTVPHMTRAQRGTLAELLARAHPGHHWLANL